MKEMNNFICALTTGARETTVWRALQWWICAKDRHAKNVTLDARYVIVLFLLLAHSCHVILCRSARICDADIHCISVFVPKWCQVDPYICCRLVNCKTQLRACICFCRLVYVRTAKTLSASIPPQVDLSAISLPLSSFTTIRPMQMVLTRL